MNFRNKLKPSDIHHIKDIVISTGFFYDSEVDIALELVQEKLEKGEEASDYIFNIAEENNVPIAYSCYGKIPGTESSFDLYWIVVHNSYRGKGIGKIIMDMLAKDIKQRSGKTIWIETSSRPLYEPTRQFYLSYGCEIVAELHEFYGKNDHKLIFKLNCA